MRSEMHHTINFFTTFPFYRNVVYGNSMWGSNPVTLVWGRGLRGKNGVPDYEQGGDAVVAAGGEPHGEGLAFPRLEEHAVDRGLRGSPEEPGTTALWC